MSTKKKKIEQEAPEVPGLEHVQLSDEPKPALSLPQKRRNEILVKLNQMGIETHNLSDEELLDKMTQAYDRLEKEHLNAVAPVLQKKLNEYADEPLCRITDKSLIERLYNMHVPKKCLKLFGDEAAKLTRQQIWQEILYSGYKPFENSAEIMKTRGPMMPPQNKRKMKDFD